MLISCQCHVSTHFQFKEGRRSSFGKRCYASEKGSLIINSACTYICTVQLRNEEIKAQVSSARKLLHAQGAYTETDRVIDY
jgi:hypothetical protein